MRTLKILGSHKINSSDWKPTTLVVGRKVASSLDDTLFLRVKFDN